MLTAILQLEMNNISVFALCHYLISRHDPN